MKFIHEEVYRGPEALEKLAQVSVTICGAGALGSQLADNLVRHGVRNLRVIDRDRVEEHNIGTQIYGMSDIGGWKAEILRTRCFEAAGAEIEAIAKELDARSVTRFLRGSDLVIDSFDNSASRRLVTEHCHTKNLPCLHLGVNADYGEVRWNEGYRVPGDVVDGDACDYPLARNILVFVATIGAEAVLRFFLDDRRESYSMTLKDLAIHPE